MLANGPFIILNISVSSPSRAMFYSVETIRLTEVAFKLLFHHASPSKGGLIWSHQIMNACGCGFILRAYLVHSLASLLVLCTSLKHPLTYNGLMLVISSSVLTLLSPLKKPNMNACGCGFILRAYLVHSLASLLVLCTSLKHPLTYNGLMLVISSSVLTLLSPLKKPNMHSENMNEMFFISICKIVPNTSLTVFWSKAPWNLRI